MTAEHMRPAGERGFGFAASAARAETPPASRGQRRLTLEERLERYQAELDGEPDGRRAWSASETPTLAELEALLAVVEHSKVVDAALALGRSPLTVRNQMSTLYAKIGARSREHAVRILWPVLGEAFVLPGDQPAPRRDRRVGRDRRRSAS